MVSQEEAREAIDKTSKILTNAPDYLDLSECNTLLEQANNSYNLGDFSGASSYSTQAKDAAMDIRNKYLMIVQELEGLEKRIAEFRESGIDVEGSQELIDQIKNSLVKNDFDNAVTLIDRNKTILDSFSNRVSQMGSEAKAALEKIYGILKQAPEYIDISLPTNLYHGAREAYTSNDFAAALDYCTQAQNAVIKLRQEYMDVVNTINEAEKALEVARNQGLTLDFVYLENLIEKAKQCLVNNDYSGGIEFAEQALGDLENASEAYIAPARNQVLNDVQDIKNFVYNLRRLEVDVSETEELYKKIHNGLKAATQIEEFEQIRGYCAELKVELERLKAEKERLDELPKQISNSMREIKQEIGFLKTKNVETYSIEDKLQEAVDLFATAEAEEEYHRIINVIEKVKKELEKVKQAAEQTTARKTEILALLNSTEPLIEELVTNGYDAGEFRESQTDYENLVNESNNPEELGIFEEDIKDFLSQIQQAIEKSREILGLKQTAMNEVNKLKAISTELVEIGGDIKDYEEDIRDVVTQFGESAKEDDFQKIIGRIDEMIPEIREKIEAIHEEKRQAEVVTTEVAAIEEDLKKLEEFTDTTEVNDLLANAKELTESKDYPAALGELDKARQLVFNLNDAQPVFDVIIDTENIEPNNWAQTDMVLTNTGLAHAKNIVVTMDGPVEIRKLKPIGMLKAGEEITQQVGIKFTDRGEIPLDIQIHCFRVKDGNEFNFNIDHWAKVGAAQAQSLEKPLVTIISPEGGASFEEGGASIPPAPTDVPAPPFDEDEEEDVYSKDTSEDEQSEEDKDVIKRMKKLNELKQLGLITEEEFNEKRKEILDNL